MAMKKSTSEQDAYKKKLYNERKAYYKDKGNPLTIAKTGIKAGKAVAKAAIKYAPGVGAAKALAKARPTTGASIAGARPKINKEQAMVGSNRYQAQAPKSKKVKITGTGSSSYEKKLVPSLSMIGRSKFVEDKPKSTKKMTVKVSKKINK